MNFLIKDLFLEEKFSGSFTRLYTSREMLEEDAEYLLGVAILLLKYYEEDGNYEVFELAYNIVLRCAVVFDQFEPLYDVALNYGFFPIVRYINRKSVKEKLTIEDVVADYKIEFYKNDNYIETYEQRKVRDRIICSEKRNNSFIAPTSSGKSSIIKQDLLAHPDINKAVVVVPSKSLILQSYTDLKTSLNDRKFINHESMYLGESRFVAVLTQERLSRLLDKYPRLVIDKLYIDEAHNILSNDQRNILLARTIKRCLEINNSLHILYLSPFINNSNSLRISEQEEIAENRIHKNIKEASIYEYRKNGHVYTYNRFAKTFYELGSAESYMDYISVNCKNKNYFFLNSPRKIEAFAEQLYSFVSEDVSNNKSITELKKILENQVHPEFKMIKLLDKGIIYLHARLPEQLKDYLEYQFQVNPSIKYLVANSVILEGINLPIDNLFILDAWNMKSSKLLNLMGRVNRLNEVFSLKSGGLNKLLPEIHFVNSEYYHGKMEKKIFNLYDVEGDEAHNPLLLACSLDDIKEKKKRERQELLNKRILEEERCYFSTPSSEIEAMKRNLISSGMNQLIDVSSASVRQIIDNISNTDFSKGIIEIISHIFTNGIEVNDQSFRRLKNAKAVEFYEYFIEINRKYDLSAIVASQLAYWRSRRELNDHYMYVGSQYGDCYGEYNSEREIRGKVYVDLRNQSTRTLVNYIVIKTKIEQDFISFQINRAINFLHDNGLIDDKRYNMEIYGTDNQEIIELLNLGMSIGVLNVLIEDKQLVNLELDVNGNLRGNEQFDKYKDQLSPYWKYQVGKYF